MPVIHLSTLINAPTERVFDLSRSIDAHIASTDGTSERAVGGVTSGLIDLGQTVTWEARHFGVKQRLTAKITKMDRPHAFEDEMVSGAFSRMHHRHDFIPHGSSVEMVDSFDFAAPFGPLGRLAEALFLSAYMTRFLQSRAQSLKRIAESEEWRRFLPDPATDPTKMPP